MLISSLREKDGEEWVILVYRMGLSCSPHLPDVVFVFHHAHDGIIHPKEEIIYENNHFEQRGEVPI